MIPTISSNKHFDVTISIKCKIDEMTDYKYNVQTICNELNSSEIALLAKAVKRPLLKNKALSALKKHI